MSILNRGFDLTSQYGSIGGVTFRRVGGVTVASQKVPAHSSAKRTPRLMLTRMRWVNLVMLWRAINMKSWHPSFVRPTKRVSDFNEFMKVNVNRNVTFLTKDIAASLGCVIAPVRLTSPSVLPSIVVDFNGNGVPESDLAVGTLSLGNSTTLKVFSDAIINNNEDWNNGDKLTILIGHQLMENTTIPVAKFDVIKVTLDNTASTTLLKDVIDISLLAVVDGCLALSGPINGGCAFIHSRIVNGETICSMQNLVVSNTYLANYQGTQAFYAAVESYGGFAAAQTLTPDIPLLPDLEP